MKRKAPGARGRASEAQQERKQANIWLSRQSIPFHAARAAAKVAA